MDHLNYDDEIIIQQQQLTGLKQDVSSAKQDIRQTQKDIDIIRQKIAKLKALQGIQSDKETQFQEEIHDDTQEELDDLNSFMKLRFPNDGIKTDLDKIYELKTQDYIVASIAGGLGVILDFLVVKIPKGTNIFRNGKRIYQKGSPITEYFRSLGADKDERTWSWIKFLEQKCKVPYDKSIDPLIKSMCPKVHRFLSLAHDPSPLGLVWAIKDITCGSFSYIDGSGVLHVENITTSSGFLGALTAPIIWIGHIISDIFTKAGIPIPGWCYLNLLQFGSFGDKKRTIAEVAKYMYYQGYDFRHLITMSIEPAVIGMILRIYHFLVNEKPENNKQYQLQSEKEYGQIQNNIKFRRMLLISLSIATAGNVGKIISYSGNPMALNFPLWYKMIKESLLNVAINVRLTKDYETVIQNRHVIDENFEYLLRQIEK